METLKLEELAPYLPHGLQIFIPEGKGIGTLDCLSADGIISHFSFGIKERIGLHNPVQWYIKPLVIPLSELTKEQWIEVFKAGFDCESTGMSVSVCGQFINLHCDQDPMTYYIKEFHFAGYDLDRYFNQLAAFQKLYQLHADLHGLIDRGLALNKLTHGK